MNIKRFDNLSRRLAIQHTLTVRFTLSLRQHAPGASGGDMFRVWLHHSGLSVQFGFRECSTLENALHLLMGYV